jgi:hypothetical protein
MRTRKGVRLSTIIAVALMTLSCAGHGGRPVDSDVVICSIVALIATPKVYEGRLVQTEGVAVIGFEADAIYLSREDLRERALLNSVGLSLHDAPITEEAKKKLQGRRVIVRGVFSKPKNELRGQIASISRIYPSEDPD